MTEETTLEKLKELIPVGQEAHVRRAPKETEAGIEASVVFVPEGTGKQVHEALKKRDEGGEKLKKMFGEENLTELVIRFRGTAKFKKAFDELVGAHIDKIDELIFVKKQEPDAIVSAKPGELFEHSIIKRDGKIIHRSKKPI